MLSDADSSSPHNSATTTHRRKTLAKSALISAGVPLLVLLWFGLHFRLTRHTWAAFPWWDAALWTFSAFLIVLLTRPLISGEAWKPWRVFKAFHPLVFVQCVLLLAATLGLAFLLRQAFPFLRWSWFNALPGAGDQAVNINILPARLPIVGPIFCVLFACNIPLLAQREEMQYRRKTRNWKHAVWRSVRFGLAHCWAGVPIYAGVALILSGLWYSKIYFDGGVERSTLHHAVYNLVVVSTLFVLLVTGWF